MRVEWVKNRKSERERNITEEWIKLFEFKCTGRFEMIKDQKSNGEETLREEKDEMNCEELRVASFMASWMRLTWGVCVEAFPTDIKN